MPLNDVDRAAIEAVLTRESAAWDAGNAGAFAADVQEGVLFTNVVGMFSIGRAPFIAQHEHIFSTIYKGSRMDRRHHACPTRRRDCGHSYQACGCATPSPGH
jgi:uncharacterized protein (TIGR02246 family)